MQSLKRIKTSGGAPKPSDIMKEKYDDNLNKMPVVFSLDTFAWKSIKEKDFNNYCVSKDSSRDQAEQFLKTLRVLSGISVGKLISNEMKKSLRFKEIRDETGEEIERIERVLKKLGMPSGKIEDFERSYHEFSVNNGMRIICVKEDNILHLLFIDNNHMICQDSSRFLAQKQLFNVPCVFDSKYNYSEDAPSAEEQIFDMAIKGKFDSVNDLVSFYDEWKNMN